MNLKQRFSPLAARWKVLGQHFSLATAMACNNHTTALVLSSECLLSLIGGGWRGDSVRQRFSKMNHVLINLHAQPGDSNLRGGKQGRRLAVDSCILEGKAWPPTAEV